MPVFILAPVVSTHHVRWLFELGGEKKLAELIEVVKRYSARRTSEAGITAGSLWQAGFYDRAARVHDDLVAISRYIVANPLRAGIVADIGQYPHWDAKRLTG